MLMFTYKCVYLRIDKKIKNNKTKRNVEKSVANDKDRLRFEKDGEQEITYMREHWYIKVVIEE